MGFAEGLNAGAQAASKWVSSYNQGKKWREDDDIKTTVTDAQKAFKERESALNADTNLSDYDRRQAINEARGEMFDTIGSKYSQYGRDEDFNNFVNAQGNARKEGREHMLDMDQRAVYQANEKAYQVKQRQGMASMVEKALKGDANALSYMQDIADYAGVQFKSENGQFMWAPKGADNAQFVPMDMNKAFEAYNAFTAFEDKIRQRLQSEALLKGDAGKLDEHDAKGVAIEGQRIANKKAISDKVEYVGEGADRTKVVKDGITGEIKSNTRRDGKPAHEFDAGQGTVSMKEEGQTVESVESALDGLSKSGRSALGEPRVVRKGNDVMVSFNYKDKKDGKVKRVTKPIGVFQEYVNQMKAAESGKNKGALGTVGTGNRAIDDTAY